MRENIKIQILQNMLEEVTKKYDYFILEQNKIIENTFEMAIRDPLTSLYNRQYLFELSNNIFERMHRNDSSEIILIFIDLDNFKSVNDTYGHKEGDHVLKTVADIFRATFRSYDTIVRYGGDEFIVFMENSKHDEDALHTLLSSFVTRVEESLKKFKISASYGVAMAPKEAKNLKKLIELADERMYAQKRKRKATR